MGTGHVTFFYDKLGFIKARHEAVKEEGYKRGFNLSGITISLEDIPSEYCNDYTPTGAAQVLNKERILCRLLEKPLWYKHYGVLITQSFLDKYR